MRGAIAIAGAAAAVMLPGAAPAGAASLNCDASALRGTVLGVALEPATANRGQALCQTAKSPASIDLGAGGLPLAAGVLSAVTSSSSDASGPVAFATGGVADLRLGSLGALGIAAPDVSQLVPAQLQTITVDLSSLGLLLNTLGLPSSIDVGLGPAIQDLLKPLPDTGLLGVQAATAYAGANCRDGAAIAAGTARVAGLTVLGQTLPVDQAVQQAVSVLDTQSIDPSNLDLSKLVLPQVIADLGLSTLTQPVLQTIQTTIIKPALDALPPISIPATLAQVSITPSQQTTAGGVLTQNALRVQVSLLGQSLADLTLGQARVATGGVQCAAAAPAAGARPGSATDLALRCTTRRLVLTDVVPGRRRVRLVGAADRKLVGRRVAIRFLATGRTVAHARVRRDGTFSTTAPLPPRSVRFTNRARYQARAGRERSLNLKLMRRMYVTGVSVHGDRVTIAGRVVKPLASPVRKIEVRRQLSCKRSVVVKRFRPRGDGTFAVTVGAPKDHAIAAVYRLATRVRNNTSNPKTYPTFTLPRGVNLEQ